MVKYDDFLPILGDFGPYQKRILCYSCIISMMCTSSHIFAQVFLAARTDHWCALPPSLETQNCSQIGIYTPQKCEAVKKALFIPSGSQCSRYDLDYNVVEFHPDLNVTQYTNGTTECIDGWTYDRSQYTSTIVQEFDLVCDKKTLPDVAQSVYAGGCLAGAFVSGWLSDRLGRKPAMFIAIAVNAVSATALAFSPNLIVYTVLRFIIAASVITLFYSCFVNVAECVGSSKRTFVGVVLVIATALSYLMLTVIAFFIRDWRTLQLIISVPTFLLFVFIPFYPESPRWLLNRGDIHKAKQILEKAAKYGKVTIPPKLYGVDDEEEDQFRQKTVLTTRKERRRSSQGKGGRRPSYVDIVRYPNMRYRTLKLMFIGFVNNLVYFGLSLGTASLGGNQFLAAFLSAAVEIPAYASSLFVIEKWGRRVPLCLYLVVSGVMVMSTIWLPAGNWSMAVALVGKFHVAASYNINFIYNAELFPTSLRSTGMGMCSMAAHLAGISAPMILSLGLIVWEPLPLLIFGVAAIFAAGLALLLPETKGTPLQETIQESEDFGKKKQKSKGQKTANNSNKYERVSLEEMNPDGVAKNIQNGGPVDV